MPKARKQDKEDHSRPATEMSTAEAAVATLIAHGLDTVYALPGVHNDHLFDAFQRARRKPARRPHPPRARRRLYGARRRAGDRQAADLRGGARPWPAQFRRRAAHRLRNERARAGDHRTNSRGGDRQGSRSSARDPRSGRHHRPAGRSFVPHQGSGRSIRQSREGHSVDEPRSSRSGSARMRHRRLGQAWSCPGNRAPCPRAPPKIDDRQECAPRQNFSAKPNAC